MDTIDILQVNTCINKQIIFVFYQFIIFGNIVKASNLFLENHLEREHYFYSHETIKSFYIPLKYQNCFYKEYPIALTYILNHYNDLFCVKSKHDKQNNLKSFSIIIRLEGK